MTATSSVPDIPFPVVLADGSSAQVHVGRQYELTYRTPADASQDFEMRATLRCIRRVMPYGSQLVFNGSPRFGDQEIYASQILHITPEMPGHSAPFLRGIPRGGSQRPAGQKDREVCLAGDDIDGIHDEVMDAFDAASDQDQVTWVTDAAGKRLCAIVPVSVAEHYDAAADLVTAVLDAPAGPPGPGPDLTARLALVIAQLIRTGILNPRHIGLPHLDSATARYEEILGGAETWLREGSVP